MHSLARCPVTGSSYALSIMVADDLGPSDGLPDGLVDPMEMTRLVAEARALETVGLERVLALFQDRLTTSERRKVRTDSFDVGQERFTLERDRSGKVLATRVEHVVGGVRIRSESLPLPQWIATALSRYQEEMGSTALVRSTLEELLGLR
jgi:hypothetical protein